MKTILFVLSAVTAWGQVDLKGAGSPLVPYVGATQDIDAGARRMKAVEFETTAAGPTRLYMKQGPCAVGDVRTGYDGAICMEGPAVFLITLTAKIPLSGGSPPPQGTLQYNTFLLSSMVISPTGTASITLPKTPQPGTSVRIYRHSSQDADRASDEFVAAGKVISLTSLPVRPYTAADWIKVVSLSLE